MIERAEAQAQLARLLGDDSLRTAPLDAVRTAVEGGIDRLASGLIAEAAESDDVSDAVSAQMYVEHRLEGLGSLIDASQQAAISALAREHIERW